VLELDGVFSIQERGILMIVVQVVMDLRRVELSSVAKGLSSDWTGILSWDSTTVVTKMVHTVLLTILLELIKAILSIRASNRLVLGNDTCTISLITAVLHLILEFRHSLVQIRVFLAG
jgi:hypothetical protein